MKMKKEKGDTNSFATSDGSGQQKLIRCVVESKDAEMKPLH